MSVGRRLRSLRTAKGLSQAQLAAPVFTHAYVSTIEAGKRNPSLRALNHFATKLGVDVQELLTGRPAGLENDAELQLQEARRLVSAGTIDDASARYQDVLDRVNGFGLPRLEAKALFGLGHCDERRGRWEEAIGRYDNAEHRAEGRFPDVAADIVAGKARCLENLGDVRYAIYVLERELQDFKRRGIEDPLALVKLHAGLAFAAHEAGLYGRASESAQEALRLAVSVDDPYALAVMNINVARVLLHEGERDAATRSLVQAEHLFDQLDLQVELGRAHVAHGFALSREGNLSQAAQHLEIASTTFEKSGTELDRARTLVELGRINRLRKRTKAATEQLDSAIDILRRHEHVAEFALAHRELGLTLFESDPARSEKNLREAVVLYERAESPLQVALTHRYIGELFEALGRDACSEYRIAASSIPEDV